MDENKDIIKHETSLSTCVDENYRCLYSNILGVNLYPNIQEVEQAHIHFIANDHSSNDVIDIVNLARLYFIDYNFYCQKNISILEYYCLQHLVFLSQNKKITSKHIIDFMNDIKLQYLYIIRDNIEYYITKKNKYIFTLLDNKVSLIPTSDDKNKTLWLIQTNNICDFSTSEILLSYFKKTITDLIQGRIETFDDKEIPTLSHINPPLLEGARIATEDDLQKVRFKTEPKAIEKTEQYNVNGSFSNKNETNYIFYTTKHKYIFTISRINGDKLLEPQNRMANTMFNEIIEAREIFPSLAKLLLILILAIVHPQISLLGFILLFILADIILYTHFFRKITFLFKNIIYLGVTKHFVFFSRFLLLDKIISSIIILYRFKYNYIIVSYLILSVLLHFLYFIRKGNPAYDCQDAITNNSLAEYSIIKYGNK